VPLAGGSGTQVERFLLLVSGIWQYEDAQPTETEYYQVYTEDNMRARQTVSASLGQ
jgi:hypothetical protein